MRWRFSGDIDTRITEREREREKESERWERERRAYHYKEDIQRRFDFSTGSTYTIIILYCRFWPCVVVPLSLLWILRIWLETHTMVSRNKKNRKKRGHVSAGHGRIGTCVIVFTNFSLSFLKVLSSSDREDDSMFRVRTFVVYNSSDVILH